ncbi:hypothetical protein [Agromyces atrinae]|uniref:Uncharacterized protein n=1 Tax=Agromyces atrinae TaxID=592376 RepID=A0A4Q2M7D0_9MICO|nr:hypothetical protein [Agromyces atrinae]NYD67653.1 hypothetical protein [Agromyces atrinae]RXZ88145.1 hypothetical protein ESP50_02890 [Agromyces atrinae]
MSSQRIPTAIIVAGDMDSNPPYERSVAAFVAAGAVRVTVAGIAHLGFTDVSHIIAPIPGVTGSQARSGPAMAAKVTLVVVTAISNKADVSSSSFASLGTHDVTALQLDDWLAGSP